MRHRTGSADQKIAARLKAKGRGWVFTPGDLLDLGTRDAVGSALKRMKAGGRIVQLRRGLYHYPKVNPQIGPVPASTETVVAALARRDGVEFVPPGAAAANQLGLSEQVPMRTVLLSDGPARTLQLGRRQIVIRHVSPRTFALASGKAGPLFTALKSIGKSQVDADLLGRVRLALTRTDRPALLKALPRAPAWMRQVLEPMVQAQD